MEQGTDRQLDLVNLNDTALHLEEPWQDLRRLDVYDINDDKIGSVEDVYVDRERREARLLDVSAGGLLGVGKKHFLVPVEEVKRDLDGERVTVEHPPRAGALRRTANVTHPPPTSNSSAPKTENRSGRGPESSGA